MMNADEMPAPGIIDAIRQRTSVRAYMPDKPDEATIRRLLAAAVRAPTALHEEPWAFAVIQDREFLKRLSERARPMFLAHLAHSGNERARSLLETMSDPTIDIFHDAGTLIVIYGRKSVPFAMADCWLAAENLMLAACAMGLGTCVIGSAIDALNSPGFCAELAVPDDMQAIAPIVVGIPRNRSEPGPRKAPQLLFWKT